ncbi:outer membrane protein transport protein [candidate division KSB1 bacterium]|nr:outer membrane protein transport protein [candidate division KSB1 bacterium]
MKRGFLRLSMMISLLCWAQLFAAGIETNGVGARATAMGGSYRAVSDDWSAMYWNPAGLAFTQGWHAGFHTALVAPRATFQAGASHYYNLYGGAAFKPFSVAYQSERSNEPDNLLVPAAGISVNTGKWAYGLGVWVPMGWGARWDVLRTASSNSGNVPGVAYDAYNAAYPTREYESDIKIIDIHPTVAYKMSDKLSFGFGLSIVLGDIMIRQPAFLQNPYLYPIGDFSLYETVLQPNTPESDLQTLEQMRRSPFDHLITEAEMKSSGMTYGANVGIMFKPTESLSIGASLQYYADLSASGDYSQITYFGDAPTYHTLAQSYDYYFESFLDLGAIDSLQYEMLKQFYSGDVQTLVDTKATATIPLPLKAGIGLSYSGFKNLLLALDFAYTQWSVWDVIEITESSGAVISQIVENWNDTFKVGIGMEYALGRTKLRGGLGYDTRAAVDESVSPTIPDIGDRYNLNLGLSLPIGPVEFGLNYEYIYIPNRTITTWIYDELSVAQNIAGTYSMRANSLMIGVDYRF